VTGRETGCDRRWLQRLPQWRQVSRQHRVPQQAERETHRLRFRHAASDELSPSIVEMLSKLVDDLVLARR
jgi:hypothetical protein